MSGPALLLLVAGLLLWNAPVGAQDTVEAPHKDVELHSSVLGVAWSHDGSRIAVVSGIGRTVDVLDADGNPVSHFEHLFNGPDFGDSVAVTKDYVILTPQSPPPYTEMNPSHDQAFSIWRTEDGTFIRNVQGPGKDSVTKSYNLMEHVKISPDKLTLAMVTRDESSILLFSTSNWQFLRFFAFKRPDGYPANLNSFAFSPDSRTLVAIAGKGYIEVINIDSGQVKPRIDACPEPKYWTRVDSMALSPDGHKAVLTCGGGEVRVIDLDSGQRLANYDTATAVRKLDWGDNDTIAAAAGDKTLRLWNWRTNEVMAVPLRDAPMSLAFAPDGVHLAVGNGDRLSLFTIRNTKPVEEKTL